MRLAEENKSNFKARITSIKINIRSQQHSLCKYVFVANILSRFLVLLVFLLRCGGFEVLGICGCLDVLGFCGSIQVLLIRAIVLIERLLQLQVIDVCLQLQPLGRPNLLAHVGVIKQEDGLGVLRVHEFPQLNLVLVVWVAFRLDLVDQVKWIGELAGVVRVDGPLVDEAAGSYLESVLVFFALHFLSVVVIQFWGDARSVQDFLHECLEMFIVCWGVPL